MSVALDSSTTPPALSTATPITSAITCGTNAKLLVAVLFINGTTTRTGGAPTYNGVTMTDSGQGFVYDTGGEAGVEIWYLLNPSTGSSYNVSVPNTGAASMTLSIFSFTTSVGQFAYDNSNKASGVSASPSLSLTVSATGNLIVGGLGSGERDIPSAGTNFTLLHTVDAGNQVWGSEYDLAGTATPVTVSFSLVRSDDWGLIGVSFKEVADTTDDLSATGISTTPVVGTPAIGQKHALSASGISTTPIFGTVNLTVVVALVSVGILVSIILGTPTISQSHALDSVGISTTPTLGTPDFSSNSTYFVNHENWFFSPTNWYVNGSSYAITNSPGAYTKLRFVGTGLSFAINLSLFQAINPGAADYPYFKWRIDGGTWNKQITTQNQTTFTFATGLTNTTHDIEIYFESIRRNIDRWLNPSASIRVNSATVTAGVLVSPTLNPERWLIFGDSRVEGVNTYGNSYSNAHQGAARSWSNLLGELQGAEVGSIGWVSQGYNWPSSVASNVDEFHKYDESSKTWLSIFNGISRSFSGIDAILVNHGVNDDGTNETQLRTSIYDFLVELRTAAPSAKIVLIVPFGSESYFTTKFERIWTEQVLLYVENTSDNNVFLLSITGINSTLDYDLSWQTPTTYSYDGGHPNQAGHDEIASILDGLLGSDNLLAEFISSTPVLGTPTLGIADIIDDLISVGISTTPSLGSPTISQIHVLGSVGISTTPSLGSPTISQIHALSAVDISTTTNLGTPTISQIHALGSVGISTTPSFATPTLSQVFAISLSGSSYIGVSGENTTARLTPPVGKSTQDFIAGRIQDDENPTDSIDIGENQYTELEWSIKAQFPAIVDDVYEFRITIDGVELTDYDVTPQLTIGASSVDNLISVGISTTPSLGTPTISQTHVLDAVGISVAPVLGTPTISQTHVLDSVGISTTPSLGTPTISQIHILTANGISTTPTLGTPSLTGEHVLDAVGISVAPVLGTPTISQIHVLDAVGISVAPILGTPSLTGEHALDAVGISTTPSFETPAISQVHILNAVGVSTTPGLGTPSIFQIHVLDSVGISVAPILGTPSLTGEHVLGAVGISTTPSLGTPTISQSHVLEASGISATPSLGTPVISQAHALSANGISTTPTLGTPSLTGEHVLDAIGISVSPVLGTSTLAQIHSLSSVGISTIPVVSTTTIGQIHQLYSVGIDVNVVLSIPNLSHIHVLYTTGLIAGPVFDETSIGQTHVLSAQSQLVYPTISVVTFGQVHVLDSIGISTSPILGSPSWDLIEGNIDVVFNVLYLEIDFTVLTLEVNCGVIQPEVTFRIY